MAKSKCLDNLRRKRSIQIKERLRFHANGPASMYEITLAEGADRQKALKYISRRVRIVDQEETIVVSAVKKKIQAIKTSGFVESCSNPFQEMVLPEKFTSQIFSEDRKDENRPSALTKERKAKHNRIKLSYKTSSFSKLPTPGGEGKRYPRKLKKQMTTLLREQLKSANSLN